MTDSRLGLPNPSLECSTCGAGAKDLEPSDGVSFLEKKGCEGVNGHVT